MPSLRDQLTNYAYSPSENYSGYAPAISYFDAFNNIPQFGPPITSLPPIVNETLRDNLVNRDRERDTEFDNPGMGPDSAVETGGFSSGAFGGMSQDVSDVLGTLGSIGLGFAPGIGPAVSGLSALSNIGQMTGLFSTPSPSNMISQALQSMFGPTSASDIAENLGFAPDPTNPDPFDTMDVGFGNVGQEPTEPGFEGFGPSESPEDPDFGNTGFGPSDISEEDISDTSEEGTAGEGSSDTGTEGGEEGEEGEGEGEGDDGGSDDDSGDSDDDDV